MRSIFQTFFVNEDGHIIVYDKRLAEKDFRAICKWVVDEKITFSFEPAGMVKIHANGPQQSMFFLKWGHLRNEI